MQREEVTGEVRSLWKYDGFYVVRVELETIGAGSVELELRTGMSSPDRAIDAARETLVVLGGAMQQAFADQGSLK